MPGWVDRYFLLPVEVNAAVLFVAEIDYFGSIIEVIILFFYLMDGGEPALPQLLPDLVHHVLLVIVFVFVDFDGLSAPALTAFSGGHG